MKSNLYYNLAYHSPYFLTEKSQYHPMIKESTKLGKSCYFTIEVLSIFINLILRSFNFVLLFTLLTNVFSGPRKSKRDRLWLIGDYGNCFLSKKDKIKKRKLLLKKSCEISNHPNVQSQFDRIMNSGNSTLRNKHHFRFDNRNSLANRIYFTLMMTSTQDDFCYSWLPPWLTSAQSLERLLLVMLVMLVMDV